MHKQTDNTGCKVAIATKTIYILESPISYLDEAVGLSGGYKRAFGLGEKLRPRMGKRQSPGQYNGN